MNRLTILPLWKNVTSVAFSIRFVVYDMVVSFHVHLITDYSHFNTIFTNETTIKVHFSSPRPNIFNRKKGNYNIS